MVEIFDGKRYDISRDETERLSGTLQFLRKARAEPIDGSARLVADSDVDTEGKYNPRDAQTSLSTTA